MEIVFCIPGKWADRSAIVTSIVDTSDGEYLFAGNLLMHVPTKTGFEIETRLADKRLQHSFSVAGQGRLANQELIEIGEHSFVLYLIAKGGSYKDATDAMHAACALLLAGGLGIKIETTGKAFSKKQWLELSSRTDEYRLYEAFVLLISDPVYRQVYSCGMHNLGLRDCICDVIVDSDQAGKTADVFNAYLMEEKPVMKDVETFSIAEDAPVYRIREMPCTKHHSEDLFFNAYGIFHLIPKEAIKQPTVKKKWFGFWG